MTRPWKCAVAALGLTVGTAGGLAAQEMDGMMGRRASLFDIGVYAGGAVTSNWYSTQMYRAEGLTRAEQNLILTPVGEETSYGIGLTPAFGGMITFWGIPWFGVRVHYAYMPSELPTRRDGVGELFGGGSEEFDDGLPLNNHFYDLDLVFRFANLPLFSRIASNAYLFVGGGGLTSDPASSGLESRLGLDANETLVCEPGALGRGACLSLGRDAATVGQGVIGIGGDIFSVGTGLGVFVELAAHGYDSPAHVGDGFVGPAEVRRGEMIAIADDRFAVTTRLVAGLKLLLGGGAPQMIAPPPPPPPPPPPAPAPEPTAIRVCVVEAGALREVEAMVMPAGDTMVMMAGQQRRFADAYPATTGYAATQDFFIQDRPVRFHNREYVRFGLSRIVTPTDVQRVGEFQGVPVFAETGAPARPEVIYLPVRPGCEFQPYQLRQQVRARG